MDRTFDAFMALVKDSCEGQANRKGYTKGKIDAPNQLTEVATLLEFEPQHGIGEIVYKCAEYLKNPREVLLVKIGGWAYILWRRSHDKQ